MLHRIGLLSGVVLLALGGCTVHVGYTPKLYLAQSDRLQTDLDTSPTFTLQSESRPAVIPNPPTTNGGCVIPPKPPKVPIPEPLQLVNPTVDSDKKVTEVLANHVVLLREFIEAERKREQEYHTALREACNP